MTATQRATVDAAAPADGGGLRRIEGARSRYTRVPNDLIEDSSLDPYELRVWEVIRLHDWQGAGWVFTYDELETAVHCKADKLRRCLLVLRDRGLVRWEGVRPRPKRYYALLPTPPTGAPESAGEPPPESDSIAAEKRLNTGEKAIEPPPESDSIAAEKRLAPEVPYLDQRLSKTIKASAVADAQRARACERECAEQAEDPLPRQLCTILHIPATPAAVAGMECLVGELQARCPRPLLSVAVEAVGWLETRPHHSPASVAFFRNWVMRECSGPPAVVASGKEQGRGVYRGDSRADAATSDAAAARRDRYHDERLKRHLARGGTEASFYGL